MKASIKECTDTSIRVVLHSPVSFANALRRILLAEVPMTAIDLVEVRENRTVLADEMLANRLGLVPIYHTRPLVLKTECDCDSYCSRCSIQFTLNEKNRTDRVMAVTGKHLVSDKPSGFEDPAERVECHNSLIIKLAPGQSLDMKCIARRGTPQTHAKYCPVTAVGFVYDRRNKQRETNLWVEEDVRKEWPGINQSEDVEWGGCNEVEMDVEIVEGIGKPRDVLLSALEIFRNKMAKILEQLD